MSFSKPNCKGVLGGGFVRWHDTKHKSGVTLSPVFTNILPAAHAVTGCDTTSLLFSIGKQSVFKVLKENPENFKDLSKLYQFGTTTPVYVAA
jgi:hypothetical protein